ncbi:deleted in malignant brain tumors 1 protein-like [Heptranchias perlo]|uniref:deleted in malignant brain tumors 1 protein-like n=1 Tax=Heptranchias perlo TaxID=212740 RepID=UPI0035597E66
MIDELIISELMISEMEIGEMMIREMMIGEMMTNEMSIGEMMISEIDLGPRKLLPRFYINFQRRSPGYSDSLHHPNARSMSGFLFRLTAAIGLSGEGATVRLVNGDSPCAGRVEIHYRGQWGTVLDSPWDLPDATVVCRELGCGPALSAPGGAHFGEGSGPVVTYGVRCGGTESALWECDSGQWGHYPLPHSFDAGVNCSGKNLASVSHLPTGLTVSGKNESKIIRDSPYPESKPGNSQADPSETVRLVNGDSPCAGRVEIHYRGQWGTVLDSPWDLPDATVVCRELGCGPALSAPGGAHFGEGSGPVVTYGVRCGGTESALWECDSGQWGHYPLPHSYDAGVICSGSSKPRLVNGGSPCAGRLEINLSGIWRTVCGDQSWDLPNAEAVCEELGCGSGVAAALDAHFGEGSGPVIGPPGCGHQRDVGVICSDHRVLRLVSGSSRCSGRVEVQYGEQWGTVCDIYFGLEDASVVCEHLQCGAAIANPGRAHFGEGTGPVSKTNYRCRGSESQLWDCPVSSWDQFRCSHGNDASVICSDEGWPPRLTNGGSRCDGRVEIYYNGSWGRVQDNLWDLNDANVVCRQLGCGYAISAYNSSKYGEGEGPVWVNDVQCDGYESQLRNCSSFTLNPLLTDRIGVGVLCSDVLGLDTCKSHYAASERSQICWGLIGVSCIKRCSGVVQVSVAVCSIQVWTDVLALYDRELQYEAYHVQIRLSDGGSPCAGLVKVYYNGTWGSVCDDSWDLADADVVCRQLGCGNALETALPASCGQGIGPVWLDELSCSGNESFLWDCPSAPWGQHDCTHKEDVMVVCSEHKEMRLVNGQHRCEGRVEVFYNGTWGTVCSENLDRKDAEVICKQLQCGPITSIKYDTRLFGEGSGPIWLDEMECNSHESFLWQCQSDPWGEHNCNHREDAGVVCSDVKVPERSHSSRVCVRDSGSKDGHLPDLGQPVRLVGGNTNCSGRVEILSNNGWGTVCDDSWDMADANVVCRQLRCGPALLAPGGAAFTRGDGVIWLDVVKCTGSESFLSDCRSSPPGQHDCYHKEDAGVICSGKGRSGIFLVL